VALVTSLNITDGSITQAKLAAGVTATVEASTLVTDEVFSMSGLTANFYNVSLTSVDYTLSGAHRVISVDLNNESQMWDLRQFRQLEQHTSWFVELGPMPTQMLIVINSAQDTVTIFNKKYMTQWMSFTLATSNIVSTSEDIKFLDGIMYGICDAASNHGVAYVDFINDIGAFFNDTSFQRYKNNINNRNAGSGYLNILTHTGMATNDAFACSDVIRDPAGTEDDSGRPNHIFSVGNDAGLSISDAGIEAAKIIANSTDTTDIDSLAMSPEGNVVYIDDEASRDSVKWIYRAQDELADGIVPNNKWSATGDGSEDLPWADTTVLSGVAILERASIADDRVSPIIVFGSNSGLAISHTKKNDNHNGLTFIANDVGNWPPYSGTVGMSLALEDVTELFGSDLTNVGTVTFATTGVIGNCANFVAASSQALTAADVAAHIPSVTGLSVGCWFRREIDSGGGEGLIAKYDQDTASDRSFQLVIQGATDDIDFSTTIVGATTVSSTTPVISLDTWYHLVGTWDGTIQRLYLDGIEVDSDAQSGTLQDSTENLAIGAISSTNVLSGFFDGQIDDVFILGRALSAKEIKFLYNRGKHALQSSINTNDALDSMDIVSVTTDEDGQWIGVLDVAGKLTILDQFGIPYLEDSTSIGTVNDIAVWTLPGAKTPSYSMAGSTAIRVVQTDQLLDEI